MSEGTDGSVKPARWGTAACLALGVILLSALQAPPLVLIPLALILIATPSENRSRWLSAGVLIGLLAVILPGGPLGGVSRSWALLLGGAYVLLSLYRPALPVFTRALAATGAAAVAAVAWLGTSGGWVALDAAVRTQLEQVAQRTLAAAREGAPDTPWFAELASAAVQVAGLQADLFPGLLALQSLAALGLASWLVARMRRKGEGPFAVRPWREFRFNDQLVWLLIAGLGLVLVPFGPGFTRVGYNLILFMITLYALRGVGVFLFLSVGASSLLMIVFGALAAIFLYPLVLGAAILIGLGDTWLDVRGRAVAASRP